MTAYLSAVGLLAAATVLFAVNRQARRRRDLQRLLVAYKPGGLGHVRVLPTVTYTDHLADYDGAALRAAAATAADAVKARAAGPDQVCRGCHGEGYVDGDYNSVICSGCFGTGNR